MSLTGYEVTEARENAEQAVRYLREFIDAAREELDSADMANLSQVLMLLLAWDEGRLP